mgnify:FL=1
MQRPPVKYIVQIGDRYLSELIYYWLYYDKPCSLLYQSPQTEGVTAVKMVVDSDRAAEFLFRVKEKTGCKLYKVE